MNIRVDKVIAWAIEHGPEDSCVSQLRVEEPLLECVVAIFARYDYFAVLDGRGSPIVHVDIGLFFSFFVSFDSVLNDGYDFSVQHVPASGVVDLPGVDRFIHGDHSELAHA